VSIVLLFKNSPTGSIAQFTNSSCSVFTDFATCSTQPLPHSRHSSTHTLAGLLGRSVFAFPQDVVSQASKHPPRCQTTARHGRVR